MRGACAGSVCGSQRAAGPAAQCRPPSSRSPCIVQCSAEAPPSCSRRQAAAAAAASLLAAAAWPAARPAAAAAAAAAEAADPSSLSNAEFYSAYPYVRPSDILPYLRDAARPGDADSVRARRPCCPPARPLACRSPCTLRCPAQLPPPVPGGGDAPLLGLPLMLCSALQVLAAIDAFAERYPMYRCGPAGPPAVVPPASSAAASCTCILWRHAHRQTSCRLMRSTTPCWRARPRGGRHPQRVPLRALVAASHARVTSCPRRCGPEKGAILERLVARQRPALALELGTFMG